MFIVPEGTEAFIEKNIEHALSILPFKIHYFIFIERQFRDMKNSKETNVVHEATKNNIIMHGIEPYYELIGEVK